MWVERIKKRHRHKINETRKRSLCKAITGRIIEVGLGTLIFGSILTFLGFPHAFEMGLGLNLLEEFICFIVTFFTERVWNRISWGREVQDYEEEIEAE